MDLETKSVDSYDKGAPDADKLQSLAVAGVSVMKLENSFSLAKKAEFVLKTRKLVNDDPARDRSSASKFLQACCTFDRAVESAAALLGREVGAVPLVCEVGTEAHASNCIELLQKRRTRTDLRDKGGGTQLPLNNTRMDVTWNLDDYDYSVEDLVLLLSKKVGDEAVIELLLETGVDGNSALHWCPKTSWSSTSQQLKISLLLLKYGARVNRKDKPDITAIFHIAASKGNSKAVLQALLLEDQDGKNHKTIMTEETPRTFAAKYDQDAEKLILHWGANREVFNLSEFSQANTCSERSDSAVQRSLAPNFQGGSVESETQFLGIMTGQNFMFRKRTSFVLTKKSKKKKEKIELPPRISFALDPYHVAPTSLSSSFASYKAVYAILVYGRFKLRKCTLDSIFIDGGFDKLFGINVQQAVTEATDQCALLGHPRYHLWLRQLMVTGNIPGQQFITRIPRLPRARLVAVVWDTAPANDIIPLRDFMRDFDDADHTVFIIGRVAQLRRGIDVIVNVSVSDDNDEGKVAEEKCIGQLMAAYAGYGSGYGWRRHDAV